MRSCWLLPFLLAGCALAQPASELEPAEPAFHSVEVRVAASMPPQFELLLEKKMPTPGWEFEVDSLDVDTDSGRIVARVSEIAPTGISVQVIADGVCRLPLGVLERGSYLLEVHLRRGKAGPHRPVYALPLTAR